MLDIRFERTGRMEDLEEAIRKAEQALDAAPKDYLDLEAMQNNLGNKLGFRFERTGRIEDLKEAIRKAKQAVEATPKGHPDLAGRLNNLGNQLLNQQIQLLLVRPASPCSVSYQESENICNGWLSIRY
jgi:tetratricopeptide (TPR) repeat protein